MHESFEEFRLRIAAAQTMEKNSDKAQLTVLRIKEERTM